MSDFIIIPTKAALKTASEEMGEEQNGADYIATLNASGQIPDDFEWDYSDNGDGMIVYNTTREAIEDWIYDNFLWHDVTVKEAFKENYTKYYKKHLFESGVNMNKVELMKKMQLHFGKATSYGNNGWLFKNDDNGSQALVEFEGNKIIFSSKIQGRTGQFEDSIDLDDIYDLIKDTFTRKCKWAFSEGHRYDRYDESYSRAGRLFESEGFDVDDTVEQLIDFANQYFGPGEAIIDDTWLFTDRKTGRSIIVRAIGSKIAFYSKRKGRPGQFEDGMDISDTESIIEDAVVDKINNILGKGRYYRESVVRNTLVDRFISQY